MPIAKTESLEELLTEELRLIFDSEMHKVDVLWDMAEAAQAPELHKTFTRLWDQSLDNINDLEKIFRLLDATTQARHIEKMPLLVRRCTDMSIDKGKTSDEKLLHQADRMWLHEIAGYLTARTYAALLGYVRVTDILQKILEEEQEAERLLSQLTLRIVRGNADFEPPPIEFPGFGFRQLQTRLKASSGSFELGKEGS